VEHGLHFLCVDCRGHYAVLIVARAIIWLATASKSAYDLRTA
jgi:hypothetical protein